MYPNLFVPLGQSLLVTAIGVVLLIISFLVLSKNQKAFLHGYAASFLPAINRGRRVSTSKTPPRSLSPEKKIPSNAPAPVDYKEVFPPSTREALCKAAKSLPAPQGETLAVREVDQEDFRKNVIPFTADYRNYGPRMYTPTEISLEEVKALGDFPNYAELSGVPLPEAYKEFDIEKAIPRPYRPFRWAYHQTMCKPTPVTKHMSQLTSLSQL